MAGAYGGRLWRALMAGAYGGRLWRALMAGRGGLRFSLIIERVTEQSGVKSKPAK